MPERSRRIVFGALTILLYGTLALVASVFGSYRYEPSGVQYAFLPGLLGPLLVILGLPLAWLGYQLRVGVGLLALPFLGAAACFVVPSISLADRVLELGRWLIIFILVADVALTARYVVQRVRAARTSVPAA